MCRADIASTLLLSRNKRQISPTLKLGKWNVNVTGSFFLSFFLSFLFAWRDARGNCCSSSSQSVNADDVLITSAIRKDDWIEMDCWFGSIWSITCLTVDLFFFLHLLLPPPSLGYYEIVRLIKLWIDSTRGNKKWNSFQNDVWSQGGKKQSRRNCPKIPINREVVAKQQLRSAVMNRWFVDQWVCEGRG